LEFDLERFYRINRRVLMWALFFFFLYLLRDYFTLLFLTFILGFVGRQVATHLTTHTRLSYRLSVILPYGAFLVVIATFLSFALPRLLAEGKQFAQERLPELQAELVAEVARIKAAYPSIDRLIEDKVAALRAAKRAEAGRAATEFPSTQESAAQREREDRQAILLLAQSAIGDEPLPDMVLRFLGAIVSITLQFLLAMLLSFLILLDYTRVRDEVIHWRASSVGAFFEETAASVVNFAAVVGRAFQCQFYIAALNAAFTLLGMTILGIGPLLLLTAIVFIFGFIPVLGVFLSSVPIILIALNIGGLTKGLWALGMIVLIHMIEAYVLNPRIYAARFHLNPVITLIILLIAHKLFGVWGMLLGIPVTHYALTMAMQIPRRGTPSSPARAQGPAADRPLQPAGTE